MTSTVEILRGAKDVLQRNGWHQGDFVDWAQQRDEGLPSRQCAVCLYGAVNLASGGAPNAGGHAASETVEFLEQVLKARLGHGTSVACWNDVKTRTVEDVYALLDAAIERAEAGDVR